MDYKTIRRLIFILTITVIGVGCSDTSTGVGGDDQRPATVEGRVDDGSSDSESAKLKGVEGAVVAARINSEGELLLTERKQRPMLREHLPWKLRLML